MHVGASQGQGHRRLDIAIGSGETVGARVQLAHCLAFERVTGMSILADATAKTALSMQLG